jgi:tetratricopeptide (TPR) repeat protein
MWPWSPRPPTKAEIEAACAFCGKGRAEVWRLIAGERSAICDACVAQSIAIADSYDEGRPEPFPTLKAGVLDAIRSLQADVPHRVSTPVLYAAEALASSMAERYNLAIEAFRLSNHAAALRLLDVPDATPTMVFNAAVAWIATGRAATALERLNAVDTAALKPVDRAQHRLNLAAALLLEPPVDLGEVEGVLDEAEALLAASAADPHAVSWRVCIENDRGDIALLRGDLGEAERRFRAALDGGAAEDPATWRRLGDAVAAGGRTAEARDAWRRGLSLVHPEAPEAGRLRARLADGAG